ncbi:MAG: aminotransferase class I/II-fold pyridoxal phosphate-dependent enzyme [Cytophagaceae bacterium]|jgi:hypothetical protein|nr:aminotransferase class I/II-fold pyridoxal phosphate-dependent enzyme [Cytophagaceae bacterium]
MIIPAANRLQNVKEYYFVKKLEEIARLNKEGKNVISFGIGSPDLAPSAATLKALSETASMPHVHGYQPYRGIPELREAIARWYSQTYDVSLNPASEVLPLMGSKEGILHLSMAFLNPGEKALVPNPGYPTYTSLTTLIGAQVQHYDLTDEHHWYPDFEKLADSDLQGVKLMWVNYPHMPTGTPARKDVFEKLVRFAHDKKILVCHDNPYSLVLQQAKPLSLLSIDGAKEVAVELNSMSKSHNMAGWRIGMLLGEASYLNLALTVKSNIDSGMFHGLQKAAIEAFQNGEPWHNERNDIYRRRREWVYKILDLLDFEYSREQVGMFVWAKPKKQIGDIPSLVDKILYTTYVFFTPGEIFGSNGAQFMRASLCVPEEKMEEAYHRLVNAKKEGLI